MKCRQKCFNSSRGRERVSGLAGVNPSDIKLKPGQGGKLIGGHDLSMTELQNTLKDLDFAATERADLDGGPGVPLV